MAAFQLYFSSALLLLALTCPLWQVGRCMSVMGKGPMTDSCVSQAQTLLENITDTLTQNNLLYGIDCQEMGVKLNTETDTVAVCAPKESKCSGVLKSKFDQESCLNNIGEDLRFYYTYLAAQWGGSSSLPVLLRLREFMESCFTWALPTELPSDQVPEGFGKRLNFCKGLKGFQLRAITINRAMSYMKSGEHAK